MILIITKSSEVHPLGAAKHKRNDTVSELEDFFVWQFGIVSLWQKHTS